MQAVSATHFGRILEHSSDNNSPKSIDASAWVWAQDIWEVLSRSEHQSTKCLLGCMWPTLISVLKSWQFSCLGKSILSSSEVAAALDIPLLICMTKGPESSMHFPFPFLSRLVVFFSLVKHSYVHAFVNLWVSCIWGTSASAFDWKKLGFGLWHYRQLAQIAIGIHYHQYYDDSYDWCVIAFWQAMVGHVMVFLFIICPGRSSAVAGEKFEEVWGHMSFIKVINMGPVCLQYESKVLYLKSWLWYLP